MKRLHILILYLVLLAVTVGTATFLVVTGEVSFGEVESADRGGDTPGPLHDSPLVRTPAPDPGSDSTVTDGTEFTGPRLYLVLDDAGHSIDHLRWFMRFPGVFTLAVLPGLEHSAEAARMAAAAGHSVILHQPMEALGGQDPGPGAIFVTDDDETIRRTLDQNIDSLPGIAGVNNHMGSKATGDRRTMEVIARELSNRKLFFLDSRTTADTVAVDVGRSMGVTVESRDVFLDNVHERDAIADRIDEALEIAGKTGRAVMIGHVTVPELAAVLTDRYDEILSAGYRFFPLEDLYSRSSDDS